MYYNFFLYIEADVLVFDDLWVDEIFIVSCAVSLDEKWILGIFHLFADHVVELAF